VRNAFNAYSSEVMRNGTPLCAWTRQLELCLLILNQCKELGTDVDGNPLTEEQKQDIEAIAERCRLHLDIAKRTLEEE
jgi:hypothetical protein